MKVQTRQLIRFAIVGVMNIAVDFTVFNTLILLFGLEDRNNFFFVLFKSVSFLAAVANSFIFNKIWVFQGYGDRKNRMSRQAINFFYVSLVGLFINTIVSYIAFKTGTAFFPEIAAHNIANGGAILGTLAVSVSSFLGYKFFVLNSPAEKQSHAYLFFKKEDLPAEAEVEAKEADNTQIKDIEDRRREQFLQPIRASIARHTARVTRRHA